jgi:drug/metabolite transporter (DMT)-like permease
MLLAYAQLALSMALGGLTFPAAKAFVAYVPPLEAAFLRFVLVAVVLAPFMVRAGRAWLPPGAKAAGDLVIFSLFGMVLFNVFLFAGLAATSAVTAGIITSTIPAATAICAALMLGERIGRNGVWAIMLAVAGVAAINIAPKGVAGPVDTTFGNLLVFGAVVAEGLYGVFSRRITGRMPVFAISFWANVAAAVMVAPFVVPGMSLERLAAVPPHIALAFVVTGLGSGLLAVVLWLNGVKIVPVGRAGVFTAMMPATAVIVAVTVLGEPFVLAHAIGLVCVLLAIAVGTGAIGSRRNAPVVPSPDRG